MPHMHYDEADASAIQQVAAANGVSMREDAGIIAARQLDYVKSQTYDRKLPPMNGLALVPQENDVPEWAETVIYYAYDQVGMAKVIANYADDLPRADVAGKEVRAPVRTIGDSYGYNINELNASAALGTNLPTRKAAAARLAVERKLNKIAMVGDEDYGLFGLTNHPNLPELISGTTGDWQNQSTTAAQIVADVNIIYQKVVTQSQGVHTPNTLALPSKSLAASKTKFMADTGGKSAFQIIRETYPNLRLLGLPEFDNQTVGDTITIAGEFDAMNAFMQVVMPFNQLPAQPRNLELVVPCMARSSGVSLAYPLAFVKVEGI